MRSWGLILKVCILLWLFLIPFLEKTLKSKMKHRMPMFHLLKVLIINVLRYENETWNKKTSQGKYYVRARKERI